MHAKNKLHKFPPTLASIFYESKIAAIEIGTKETKRIELKGSEELYIDTQKKTTRFTINYQQTSKS